MRLLIVHHLARRSMVLVLFALVFGGASRALAGGLAVEPLTMATARGGFHFTVEIADNNATREHGLMFRKSLAPDQGMLFDFKTPQSVAFWMKNTLIPLDILFIAADGHIVSIARNAVPMSETPIPGGGDVLCVLEVRGGRAAEIGAEPGDLVTERRLHH